jgi:hypothetical protein
MGSSLMLLQSYEEHCEALLNRIVTGDGTWVFHYTPERKAESMTCQHLVFWDVHGVLLVDFTPRGSTINAAVSQETPRRLMEAIRRKRPGLLTKGLGVLLLHHNARSHNTAATVNLLNSWGCEILPHPIYSLDLAPSDFHLFPKMKKILRSQRFHSNEDVQNEVKKWLRAQDVFFFLRRTWQFDTLL